MFIRCSKGTYVRSIAEDMGQALGCGAHVKMLRRTQAGPFDEAQLVNLATLEALQEREDFAAMDALLQPVDTALLQFPSVELIEASTFYMLQGQPVQVPNAPLDGWVRMYSEAGQFIGLGEILDDGRVGPKRLIATN